MVRFAVAAAFLLIGAHAQAAGVGDVFGALMGRSAAMGNEASLDEALAKVAAQMNRKMPITVDKETRLDSISAEPGARLIYHYTLTGMRSTDINPVEFNKAVRPRLKSRLCSDPEMQNFLKNGVTVSYLYRGSDGGAVGRTEFAPSTCANA
jgi:hypothetical protein